MATYDYTAGAAEPAAALDRRQDPKAARIRRMLGLPDLSRQPGSPVRFLLRRVLSAPCLAGMDDVIFPEILSTRRNFDLLNTPPDHPSRRTSDTFYVEKDRF